MHKVIFTTAMIAFSLICGCVAAGPYNADNVINQLTLQTEKKPTDGWAYYHLCEAYINNNKHKEALDSCKTASQSIYYGLPGPNIPWLFNALGLAYAQNGQTEEAIESTVKSIQSNPNDAVVFGNLATYYNRNKQYDEAITAAKRSIELKPDYVNAYNEIGTAAEAKEKFSEAASIWKKSLKLDSRQEGVSIRLGYCLEKTGNNEEAAQVYINDIRLGGRLRNLLMSLYYRMGRYDAAIAAATEAIEQQTTGGIGASVAVKADYPVVAGVMNTGPAKKAEIQSGDKFIEIDGEAVKGWNVEKVVQRLRGIAGTQVVLTIERNKNRAKKTVAREKITLDGAAFAMGIRSLAYRHKGDFDKAANDAKAAMELAPSDGVVVMAFGAASLDRGEYNEAIQLVSKMEGNSVAGLIQATALAKKGLMNESIQVFLSIPERNMSQNDIPLMKDLQALQKIFKPVVKASMDKATSFEARNMHKEALSALSETLKIADDSDAQAIYEAMSNVLKNNPLLAEVSEEARKHALRAELLIKEGNFSQAVIEYKKAIQIAPYVPKLYYNCAQVCAEIKNYSDAIRSMKTYLIVAADAPDARKVKDDIIMWEFMLEKGQ